MVHSVRNLPPFDFAHFRYCWPKPVSWGLRACRRIDGYRADLPSRDEFEVLERLGGRRVPIAYPPAEDWVGPLDVWTPRLRSPAD